jgi:hypothetical protein
MYETAKGDVDWRWRQVLPSEAFPVRQSVPTIEELKQEYRAVRNSPEVKGASVPIDEVRAAANTAEQELLARGNRPTTGSAPRTFNEIDRLKPPAHLN